MVSLSICCALIGAGLGLRFKVLVLVPATAITLIAVMSVALSSGTGLSSALIFTMVGAVFLQLGYLGGLVGSGFAASGLPTSRARAADPRSAH